MYWASSGGPNTKIYWLFEVIEKYCIVTRVRVSQVLWPLVRFPLRWPISRPSLSVTFFPVRAIFWNFVHCNFVLNFSLSTQKQHILVLRNTPNCSSVHCGMTGFSLAELALHNRCVFRMNTKEKIQAYNWISLLKCILVRSHHILRGLELNLINSKTLAIARVDKESSNEKIGSFGCKLNISLGNCS